MSIFSEQVHIAHKDCVNEYALHYKNRGTAAAVLQIGLPFDEVVKGTDLYLQYFTSRWSQEFTPVLTPARSITLQGCEGRCSAGMHPMIFLLNGEGGCELALAVAWSGNWTIELQTVEGGIRVRAGMTPENFETPLEPGKEFTTPRVLVVRPTTKTLNEVAKAFSAWHREINGIQNSISRGLPVEWNHWWSYEDYAINEEIFLQNAERAAELGFEAIVLDAGWYGETASWYQVRGDWDHVNTEKFPHGIRYLSDKVHAKGMKFGLWCEIESLGIHAKLAESHPEFVASRDGKPLGYVCFGNPDAQEWAYQTLHRMITEYQLDWIKLDFNLDPWAGCSRTDHGHGSQDGLYAHYKGYYMMLDRVRANHPEVLLENCGSGGMRLDHEILHHTYCTYLSDNDETANKLRFYSTIFHFLPPEACLHWSWSHSRVDAEGKGPFPSFHPEDGTYAPYELDFHMRCGMLGWLGFSHPLIDFDAATNELFQRHIRFYREIARDYVKCGQVSLPGFSSFAQPQDGYAFCYTIPERDSRLLFVFQLEEGVPEVKLEGLRNDMEYVVSCEDTGESTQLMGAALRNGVPFGCLRARESRVVRIDPVTN